MRSPAAASALAVALVLAGGACEQPADADATAGAQPERACAEPTTVVEPPAVAPGSDVTVTAELGCADTPNDPQDESLTGVEVLWGQDGATTVLARADSDATGRVSVTVTVPDDASPGDATVTVGTALPARVTVEG